MPHLSRHMASRANVPVVEYTDVAIVGNGPSAIALSFMLSGWTPYYSPPAVLNDPDDVLHSRLASATEQPITDMDLEQLSSGLEGRSSSPLALLYDQLAHPAADRGADEPPRLRWELHRPRAVSHLVLGSGLPGGSWHAMSKDMRTLSRSDWIELPNFPFRRWYAERRGTDDQCGDRNSNGPVTAAAPYRALAGDVGQYYADYVRLHNLEENFWSGYRVDRVERVGGMGCAAAGRCQTVPSDGVAHAPGHRTKRRPSHEWRVHATRLSDGSSVVIAARYVVLATGVCGHPPRLGVPGEDEPYVRRTAAEAVQALADSSAAAATDRPVVVVGSGVSAADAALAALRAGRRVVHVYRRPASDRGIVFGSLPSALYPDYRSLGALMRGERVDALYETHAQSRVVEFGSDGTVTIERLADGRRTTVVGVCLAVVLIGSQPDLTFMPFGGRGLGVIDDRPVDGRDNPVAVDPFTYQCLHAPSLFAMGPLVGDGFVRFLQGAALGITKRLRTAIAESDAAAQRRGGHAITLDYRYQLAHLVTAE